MKNVVASLLFFTVLFPLLSFNKINCSLEEKIINYIKKDYQQNGVNIESLKFIIPDNRIRYSLTAITPDVMTKKYEKRYGANISRMIQENKALFTAVYDSLEKLNTRLNSQCQTNQSVFLPTKLDDPFYYIFFSEKCENHLYVEVASSYNVISQADTFNIHGRAQVYLFEIEGQNIKTVYNSFIDYE